MMPLILAPAAGSAPKPSASAPAPLPSHPVLLAAVPPQASQAALLTKTAQGGYL